MWLHCLLASLIWTRFVIELKFAGGSMISIDCTATEDEIAKNMCQRPELDDLVYNDPVGCANLILNDDPEKYLKKGRYP